MTLTHINDPEAVEWSLANPNRGDHQEYGPPAYRMSLFQFKDDNELQYESEEECGCAFCNPLYNARTFNSRNGYLNAFEIIMSGGEMSEEDLDYYVKHGFINRRAGAVMEIPAEFL